LKVLAKKKYESVVSAVWDCTFYTSPLELLHAETPKTDQLLKDFATKAATSHVKERVKSPELADLCKKNGEIEFDVLKVSFSLEVTKQCPSCPKYSALEVIALTLFGWVHHDKT